MRDHSKLAAIETWFDARNWRPLAFQQEVWREFTGGRGGLLHATTGSGKTLAVAFGGWQAFNDAPSGSGLKLLWITPMRALAADTARTLTQIYDELYDIARGEKWTVGLRTGDTQPREREKQRRRLPSVLVTTPESLTLMLSYPETARRFENLDCVVVDEWHELLGSKRGVQTQLALARLSRWRPELIIWGLSATLGDLAGAKTALLGENAARGRIVAARLDKTIVIDTLIPENPGRFPWAGHLGLPMLRQVVREIENCANTLVFTNTRAQAELWHQHISSAMPEWAERIAVHHGSLARETRETIEQGLKNGALKAVVCTSSLDLGVDFLPVERVLQIGSAKGVARLLQRAGRSGHAPGRPSRVTLVPSHGLELIEAAAARAAADAGTIESVKSAEAPLDVLVQHLVTIGLGGGFQSDELLREVRTTHAYRNLSETNWNWCLDFIRQGGPSLRAYPEFRRCVPERDGLWRCPSKLIAARHRGNIGTIASHASIEVQYGPTPLGAKLGAIEESFFARLKPSEKFWFSGRLLEFVRIRDSIAYVRKARGGDGATPRWAGGRMPLSTTLADAMLEQFSQAARGAFIGPEMQAAAEMLMLQARVSALPTPEILLLETLDSREGSRLFVYPFLGRVAHLGMASLVAWRAARGEAGAFTTAANDYGFEILSATPRDFAGQLTDLFDGSCSRGELARQALASSNAAELAKRRFRDIARVAGLVLANHPGGHKRGRQLQASSDLYFDVFQKFDSDNALLREAEREVLEAELDIDLLIEGFERLRRRTIAHKPLARCSPLAFPLMVESLRERMSTEELTARVERMIRQLERAGTRA